MELASTKTRSLPLLSTKCDIVVHSNIVDLWRIWSRCAPCVYLLKIRYISFFVVKNSQNNKTRKYKKNKKIKEYQLQLQPSWAQSSILIYASSEHTLPIYVRSDKRQETLRILPLWLSQFWLQSYVGSFNIAERAERPPKSTPRGRNKLPAAPAGRWFVITLQLRYLRFQFVSGQVGGHGPPRCNKAIRICMWWTLSVPRDAFFACLPSSSPSIGIWETVGAGHRKWRRITNWSRMVFSGWPGIPGTPVLSGWSPLGFSRREIGCVVWDC